MVIRSLMGILALAFALCAPQVEAREVGRYDARIVRVVDGDTVLVAVPAWPPEFSPVSVRLEGIDTPEMRGKCEAEKRAAREARDWLRQQLPAGSTVTLVWSSRDKYGGRVVGRILTSSGDSIADRILRQGLARPYDGGTKSGWCDTS